MSKDISIQNGANLNLKGLASKEFEVANKSLTYALNPDDFFALVPRMLVKEGDFVKKGDPVFFDKNYENIKIVSPVSGKIKQIVRGEKRKILNVIIDRSGDDVRNFNMEFLYNYVVVLRPPCIKRIYSRKIKRRRIIWIKLRSQVYFLIKIKEI